MSRPSTKSLALSLSAVVFAAWLTWSVVMSRRESRRAILATAAQFLGCTKEQIRVGPDVDPKDDHYEYEVLGCGKKGLVSCTDASRRHGLVAQYFVFDHECAFHVALASGGYDPTGTMGGGR